MCRLDTQKRYCQFCNIRSRSAQTWVLNFRRCDHIPVKFKCIPPNSKVNSASVIVKRFEIPTRLRSMLHNISPTRHSWTQTTRGSSWIRESKLSSWVHQSFKLRPDFSVNLDVNSHFAFHRSAVFRQTYETGQWGRRNKTNRNDNVFRVVNPRWNAETV